MQQGETLGLSRHFFQKSSTMRGLKEFPTFPCVHAGLHVSAALSKIRKKVRKMLAFFHKTEIPRLPCEKSTKDRSSLSKRNTSVVFCVLH